MSLRTSFAPGCAAASSRSRLATACTAALLAVSCVTDAPPPPPGPTPPGVDLAEFSGGRAWQHLEAIARIGERQSGSRGSRRARAYFRRELERFGVEVREQTYQIEWQERTLELTHLFGVLPGASQDAILLVAHFDTQDLPERFVGANDGGSGPALLLELARVLAREPRPYTIWLAFLDGEALGDGEAHLGSQVLAAQLAEEHRLERLRLVAFFNQVADRELEVARDLRSHRSYRELFWDSAAELGYTQAFSTERGFASPDGAHESFLGLGVRPVVAIVDDRYGGPTPPGYYAHSKQDDLAHCSQRSLEVVGRVAIEAISRLELRLTQIDRFGGSPLSSDPGFGAYLAPPDESPEETVSPTDAGASAGAGSAGEPASESAVSPAPSS